jgi:Restriction endonuclease
MQPPVTRAAFTILDVPLVSRGWLRDLAVGQSLTANAPITWAAFVRDGSYAALMAVPTTVIRGADAQLPRAPQKIGILYAVWRHFQDAPVAFESFAAHPFQMHDPRVIIYEITRATIDGGRDAIGRYRLGLSEDPIYAEFSLEAKCYSPGIREMSPNTVGVREVSRLISRIRHRQFGVLVTTSVIGRQAYEEVREDRHPIIFILRR